MSIILYIIFGIALYIAPLWVWADEMAKDRDKAYKLAARLSFAFPIWPVITVFFMIMFVCQALVYVWRLAEFGKMFKKEK